MPIPTKPLREMIESALAPYLEDPNYSTEMAVSAVMAALAAYDSCFAKAAEKMEPTFTLRAQDKTADVLIEAWIDRNDQASIGTREDALCIAEYMRAWPERKLPD